MKLSDNFYLIEFVRSQAATRRDLENYPDEKEIYNLRQLCQFVLQPLRNALGVSLHISSGYRCLTLNTLIGGSRTSQHTEGKAADIDHPTKNKEIFDYIKNNLDYDQLINEFPNAAGVPSWVHVSYATENRKEILKAFKGQYGTEYMSL